MVNSQWTDLGVYTKLFGGRVSEVSLVQLWGSLGIAYADIDNWKDWARNNDRPKKLKLKTSIDDVDVELTDLTNILDEDGKIEQEMDLNEADEYIQSETNEEAPSAKKGNYMSCIDDCRAAYRERKKAKLMKDFDSDVKTPFLVSVEEIENESMEALLSGLYSSLARFVAQLECHERLHKSFEANKIRRCSLSYYLLFFESERHDLLAWVGSHLAPENHPVPERPPKIALRLTNSGPHMAILADKGFIGTNETVRCHRKTPVP